MRKRARASAADPIVLSLMVRAEMKQQMRTQGRFEVLVRHLLDRLLHSEALAAGEEAASSVLQLAYAVALPGLLYALYRFVAYHQPGGKPAMWAQAGDHLFYVTYAFVVTGLGMVLEWDVLFPDRLDALILAGLPMPESWLLLARITAMILFFGGLILGTNVLGILFMPAVADLPGQGFRLMGAQAVAVLTSGFCAAVACVALQGLLICISGRQLMRRILPVLQVLVAGLLFTTLFLEPVLAHFLQSLLLSGDPAVRWFPPFWFLGIYEQLLLGSAAPALFFHLAQSGVWAAAICLALACATYPVAVRLKTREAIEGAANRNAGAWKRLTATLFYTNREADPRRRAVYSLISQTLLRVARTRLLLAIFGGLGLATTVASLLLIRVGPHALALTLSPEGVRLAIPIVAFWTVAALRSVLHAPILKDGSWAFRVVHGRAKDAHLYAAYRWVASCALLITLSTVQLLHLFSPAAWHGIDANLTQLLIGAAVPISLADLFFSRQTKFPFAEVTPYSVDSLSIAVVTYFLLFPALCSGVVVCEPWIEAAPSHLLVAGAALLATHLAFRWDRKRFVDAQARVMDLEDQELLPGEMGLRT